MQGSDGHAKMLIIVRPCRVHLCRPQNVMRMYEAHRLRVVVLVDFQRVSTVL